MPLLVECTSCGKKYNADESMAGRRIKCRQCGTVFVVPSLSGDDELNQNINALAEMESSQAGESMVHESIAGSLSAQQQTEARESDEADSPSPSRHRGFHYSYSAVVDRWLPILLTLGGAAWVMYICFSRNDTGTPWLAAVRGIVLLILYLLLLFPLGLKGMQMAGRDTGFALPRDSRWLAMATFMPAFAFAALFWIIGGTITTLVLGLIVGFAFSVGAMFLLFHMDPKDLPAAAGYGSGMFTFGVALAAGILIGLNILLSNVLVSEHKADRLAGSPFGAAFSWPQPQVAPPPMARKTPPKPAAPSIFDGQPANNSANANLNPTPNPNQPASPTSQEVASATPTPTPTPTPNNSSTASPATQSTDPFAAVSTNEQKPSIFDGKPGNPANATNVNPPPTPQVTNPSQSGAVPQSNSPFVASVELAPVDGKFDEMIRPSAASDWIALMRKNGDRGEIDRYWAGSGDAPTPPTSAVPSGSTAATKAWTIDGSAPFVPETTVPNRYALSADGDLLAHVTTFPSLSVAVYSFNKNSQLQSLKLLESDGEADVVGFIGSDRILVHRSVGGNEGFEIWSMHEAKNVREFRCEPFGQAGSPLAISPDGSMLAIASRDQPRPGSPGGAAIYVHDLSTSTVRRLAISDLDPRWDVAPTGLAFSPDNTKVAVLFEQGPNGLLVILHSRMIGKPLAEQVFNPMPVQNHDFFGSSVIWFNEDSMLLYGQTIVRSDNGHPIGDVGIPNSTSQHFSMPDLLEISLPGASGDKQIAMVKLKMDEIDKAATSK